jgi:two-component system, sensor histidine kinase
VHSYSPNNKDTYTSDRKSLLDRRSRTGHSFGDAHDSDVDRSEEHVLAILSHEFRTPLSVILGYADLLQSEVNPEHSETVDAIIQSGKTLLSTLNSVLEWMEMADEKQFAIPESINVGNVFDDVVSQYRSKAQEKDLRLVSIAPTGDIKMISDDARIRSVLGYLVDNAIKFTERGEVRLSLSPSDRFITFVITDTGAGLSQAQMENLKAPFAQASVGDSRRYGGIGLGLTLAQEGVRLLKGTLVFRKREEGGTQVVLSLPRVLKSGLKKVA